MEHAHKPEQMTKKFFTPWVIFLSEIALIGLAFFYTTLSEC